MITIGGVTLTSDVVVSGLSSSGSTDTSLAYSIGGEAFVVSTSKVTVPLVSFNSEENFGWQTRSVVDSLIALEAAGDEVAVNVNGDNFTAVFVDGFNSEKVFKSIPLGHKNDFYKINFNLFKIN